MKKSLLATVAAAALFAGTGFAVSQAAKEPAAKAGAEMNRGADVKGGAEMKGGAGADKADKKAGADVKPDGKAQMKSDTKADTKPSTTGQGAADQKAQSKDAPPTSKTQAQDNKAQDKPASRTQAQDSKQPAAKSAQDNKAQDTKANTTGQGAAGSTQAAGAVSLTTEQKTKIRTTVIQSSSAPKVSRSSINFNISVGTVVPRTVKWVSVPMTLVEIYPAWRGHSYFIVDDEIIIVDARTGKIIAVVAV
jgi:hypothetical protein